MQEKTYTSSKFDFKLWKKILAFIKPHKKYLIGSFSVMAVVSFADAAFPLLLGKAIDNFIVPATSEGMGLYSIIYIALILLQGFGVVLMLKFSIRAEMGIAKDMRRAAFVHLQELNLSYYNQNAVGWILARIMSDSSRISEAVAWAIVDLSWGALYMIIVFIVMFILNWKLALMVFLIVPVMILITYFFQPRFLKTNRKAREINSKITGAFNEGITGAKTSKTLVIEEKNCAEFEKITTEMYHASRKAMLLRALYIPVIIFASSVAVSLVMVRGGSLAIQNLVEIGVLSTFVSYALMIIEPVQQIGNVLSNLVAAQANVERVTGLLDAKCDIVDTDEVVEKYGDIFNKKTENWEPIKGDIEFKDVWFKYPDGDEWILEDFNLKIPAGTNVAIVGETGAGKSTLVNLACRFYEPTKGQVLIDGRDYKERSKLWLHSGLGYVLQNPHLFSGSVMDNIRYGRLDATDEEVYSAAKLVSADLVVSKLEDKYKTDVGEGGDRLSTGEKQLISFARAVLADPPIFVLDEATSSVDTETENLIQNAISHILTGRTSFLIAHRLSTIRHADLILVVKDGKIIERGTHAELLGQKGYYHNLYTAMKIDEATV